MLKEIDADLEIHGLDCVQDRLDLLHRHILGGYMVCRRTFQWVIKLLTS
jgi:hypothetical protein